jgi:DNA invertase Pin-like site-specific DNA recombinase
LGARSLSFANHNTKAFLEQIRQSEQPLSEEERLQLLLELFRRPASSYRSPGAGALGRQPMKAVGYLRNSVGKLLVSTSIPRQLEQILEYCARMKLILSDVFADPDTSGVTLLQRPGLMRMLLQVRAGLVDVIITEAPDRIGRAISSIGITWDIISRHNIPLINLQDGTPLTEQTMLLYGFMAANEHAKIKARTSDGARRKAKDNNAITKRLAYGHYREYPRGPVKIHLVQSRIILEAFVGYDAGLTTGQLAAINNKIWNRGDVDYMPPHLPSHNYGGKELIWKHCHFITGSKALSGILENEQCIGYFHHGLSTNEPDPLKGKVAPIYPDVPTIKPVHRPELAFIPIDCHSAY